MRLTLRTMLAYLDGILDAENSEQLGKKIESSQFASALVHRVRDCIRRLRLGAPPLEGRGLGRDANTVAEYLDNTLPQDRVPDFEKVCLESDAHLAEVASCHQILALVHSEHREVPNSLRRRVYTLNQPESRGAAATSDHAAAVGAASAASTPGESPSPVGGAERAGERSGGDSLAQPSAETPAETNGNSAALPAGARKTLEVPEYLRDGEPRRSPLVPVLATLLVTFLMAAVALLAMGPLNREHPVLGWLAGGAPQESPEQATAPEEQAPERSAEGQAPAQAGDAGPEDAAAEGSGRAGAGGPDGEPPRPAERPAEEPPAESRENEPEAAGEAVGSAGGPNERAKPNAPGNPNDPENSQNPEISGDRDNKAGAERPGRATTIPVLPGLPVPPPAAGGLPGEPAAGDLPDAPGPAETGGAPGLLPGEPGLPPSDALDPLLPSPSPPGETRPRTNAPKPPADGMDVGRFISETQLLLRYEQDHWTRVPANAPLVSGDQLQVLPTYRPQAVLANSIKLTFAGESAVRLGAISDEDLAQIALLRGRALILTVGRAGTRLQLEFAGRQGVLVLNDADSGVAVDVQRFLPPGADPRQDSGRWLTQMFVVSGTVTWQEDSPEAGSLQVALQPGEAAVLAGNRPPRVQPAGTPPDWIDPRGALSPIDREASVAMEPLIQVGRPASLALLELTEHRQTEVRALAARCLGYLEKYDPLVDQLNDPRQRSYWDELFHALRDGLTRSADSAARLEIAFQRRQPNEAEILYRLVQGYSPEQLEAGGAEQLVNYLEHPSMAVRVLALQNLKTITGGVTHLFRPEQEVEEERSKVLRWRERLREGAIRYESVPQPLPPPGAAAEAADRQPAE